MEGGGERERGRREGERERGGEREREREREETIETAETDPAEDKWLVHANRRRHTVL